MKKVAVIGLKGLPAFGGAAAVGENIINQLKTDYDFTVYSISSHTTCKTGHFEGYQQIVFRRSRIGKLNTFLYFFKSTLHAFFCRNYDIIHVHHYSSGYIIPLLRLRYKVIVTFHGINRKETVDPKFGKLTNRFLKWSQFLSVRFANNLVSVSSADANYLYGLYGKKVMYIPNGVSISGIYSQPPADFSYVFAANRIYEIKGLHLILQAMKRGFLQEKLIVIGDLSHDSEYAEMILSEANGLNVTFKGLIKEKKLLFESISQNNIFLFPSLTEAMSMMLLEVASLKVPIIASDIVANKAVFKPEEVFFFQTEDPESLLEQMIRVRENYTSAKIKAENAFQKVTNDHQWVKVASKYQQIYQSITDTH